MPVKYPPLTELLIKRKPFLHAFNCIIYDEQKKLDDEKRKQEKAIADLKREMHATLDRLEKMK
jgi:hypothetical protein